MVVVKLREPCESIVHSCGSNRVGVGCAGRLAIPISKQVYLYHLQA